MARALGSYPNGRWFKSDFRYHNGPLVKRLRHGPFTAVTWVRFPYGSPAKKHCDAVLFLFFISAHQVWERTHLYPSLFCANTAKFSLRSKGVSRTGHQLKSTAMQCFFVFHLSAPSLGANTSIPFFVLCKHSEILATLEGSIPYGSPE